MKTLKTLINQYFEERVEYNENTDCFCWDTFVKANADLSYNLNNYGVDGVFPEWYDFVPDCWDKHLIPAIKSYVKAKIEPFYHTNSILTAHRGL